MKKITLFIIASLITAVTFAQNVKPYTVDLNSFPAVNDEKTAFFDKKTGTVSTKERDAGMYLWLGLDVSNYNIVRVKYKAVDGTGFMFTTDYADQSIEWEKQTTYCPSYLTEMVIPLFAGQKKLEGIYVAAAWGAPSERFVLESIAVEKVSNPQKTDIYATDAKPVIDSATSTTIDKNLTAWDFVKNMGAGIQYPVFTIEAGTSIEFGLDCSTSYAKTTKERIHCIKEKGFKTIRLQTDPGIGQIIDKDYTINPQYLSGIKQVIDWCFEEDLNVILCGPFADSMAEDSTLYHLKVEERDIHFVGYYINEKYKKESKKFLEAVWIQYAQAFNNSYDEHLIFETLNEPIDVLHEHAWFQINDCATCKKDYAIMNEYNQLIVDTIRSTGGNNANRFIMVEGLTGGANQITSKLFKLPKDKAKNKLIPTFHQYPMGGSMEYASKLYATGHKKMITDTFAALDKVYFSKHIPVYVSETGHNRHIPVMERINCMKDFMAEVTKPNRSCAALLNNDGDLTGSSGWFSGYYDTWNLKWNDTEYLDTFIYAANGKEFKLSDEFIKKNEVKIESIVGKNLLTEPLELIGSLGGIEIKGYTFIRSTPEKYKLEFEIESLSSKARLYLAYFDINSNWAELMTRKNVKLEKGGTLDNAMIMVKDNVVVVSVDKDTKLEYETSGLQVQGEDIIIKSVKVVE